MGFLSSASSFLLALPNLVNPPYSAETRDAVTGNVNVLSKYVEVCKCKEVGDIAWACDSTPLGPSARLDVCVKSTSSNVEIYRPATMVASQGSSAMDFEEALVTTASIVDTSYVHPKNGVAASVFVPSNIFKYVDGYMTPKNGIVVSTVVPAGSFDHTAGASVNIAGTIDVKLAGAARKLRGEMVDAGLGFYPLDPIPYELEIYLQDEAVALEQGPPMDNSGSASRNRASTLLGMPFLFASVVWYWIFL